MQTYTLLCSCDNREFVTFNVDNPPLQFGIPLEGQVITAKMLWVGSPAFTVEVTCEREIIDLGELVDVISHTLAGLYDSVGLATGKPLNVKLEGLAVVGTNKFGPITLGIPNFADTIQSAGITIGDWVNISVQSPQLRAGLRDIRLAMQTPGEAAVHCFRAIERIRQSFSIDAGDRKRTWTSLREALNIERSWLDAYTQHATAVRHGELVQLKLEDRNKCYEQAALVVIRYAAYLKAGRKALEMGNFPVLS